MTEEEMPATFHKNQCHSKKIRQLDIILPFFFLSAIFFNCGEGEGGSCMLQNSILAFSEYLMLSMNNYGHYGATVLCQFFFFRNVTYFSLLKERLIRQITAYQNLKPQFVVVKSTGW